MSYNLRGTITVSQLAKTLDLKWHGLDGEIDSVAAIQDASKGNLTFASNVAVKASDATVICEEPKITPHKEKMKEILTMETNCSFVNIKATTAEGLGSIGRKEGIAAMASVSLLCK